MTEAFIWIFTFGGMFIKRNYSPEHSKVPFLPLSGETGAHVAEVSMLDFLTTPYPSHIFLTHAPLFCHKYSLTVLLNTLCLNAHLHTHSSLSCTSYLRYCLINKNTELKLAFFRSWCFFLVKKKNFSLSKWLLLPTASSNTDARAYKDRGFLPWKRKGFSEWCS